MRPLTLPAPAKLNRILRITGRRDDGYHELQTLFQLLAHGDTLHFRPRADGHIHLVSTLDGVDADDNLVVRAARLLQRETGCREGADITLDKRLPLGGGVGGGSSDAATTLMGLNRLWELGLSPQRLAELGLELGADVPVFVHGRSAWAEGVGERLIPVELPTTWLVVVHPGVSISTADVFSHPGLTRHSTPISMRLALDGGSPDAVWRNDCESVVRALHPEVDRALTWLSGHRAAMLTGTGACVFASFEDPAAAGDVASRVPDEWQAFTAQSCNVSPLHRALGLA